MEDDSMSSSSNPAVPSPDESQMDEDANIDEDEEQDEEDEEQEHEDEEDNEEDQLADLRHKSDRERHVHRNKKEFKKTEAEKAAG